VSGVIVSDIEGFALEIAKRPVSLFFDYDGTLTPIAAHPEKAFLSYKTKTILKALSGIYQVAIVSGRGLADLKERVGIDGITYVANHGWEISAPDYTLIVDQGAACRAAFEELRPRIDSLCARFGGALFEQKGATFSVHYRMLDARFVAAFCKEFEDTVGPFIGAVSVFSGKMVYEVRPSFAWNKGSAVEWLLSKDEFCGTYPVYIGDDTTDKDAFAVVNGRGVSIYVGVPDDSSDYVFSLQSDVDVFLAKLKDLCRGKRQNHG